MDKKIKLRQIYLPYLYCNNSFISFSHYNKGFDHQKMSNQLITILLLSGLGRKSSLKHRCYSVWTNKTKLIILGVNRALSVVNEWMPQCSWTRNFEVLVGFVMIQLMILVLENCSVYFLDPRIDITLSFLSSGAALNPAEAVTSGKWFPSGKRGKLVINWDFTSSHFTT